LNLPSTFPARALKAGARNFFRLAKLSPVKPIRWLLLCGDTAGWQGKTPVFHVRGFASDGKRFQNVRGANIASRIALAVVVSRQWPVRQ